LGKNDLGKNGEVLEHEQARYTRHDAQPKSHFHVFPQAPDDIASASQLALSCGRPKAVWAILEDIS
jgi:hypothetical protein